MGNPAKVMTTKKSMARLGSKFEEEIESTRRIHRVSMMDDLVPNWKKHNSNLILENDGNQGFSKHVEKSCVSPLSSSINELANDLPNIQEIRELVSNMEPSEKEKQEKKKKKKKKKKKS